MAHKTVQNVFEKLSDQVKHTATTAAQEPAKIAGSLIGESSTADSGEAGGQDALGAALEQASGSSKTAQASAQGAVVAKKRMDDQQKTAKLLEMHRQRLRESEEFQRSEEQKKIQETKLEEQQEAQEEQEEVLQLKRQEAKDAVLNAPTAASQKGPQGPLGVAKKKSGTKEMGKLKD